MNRHVSTDLQFVHQRALTSLFFTCVLFLSVSVQFFKKQIKGLKNVCLLFMYVKKCIY